MMAVRYADITLKMTKKRKKHITREEYDSFHNYNIESNSIDRDRE